MSEERRGFRFTRRVIPVVVGIACALVFGELFLPKAVDVFLHLPEPVPEFSAVELRVVRGDGLQVLRARRPHQPGARSIVLATRLRHGTYRVEAWPVGVAGEPRWEGTFAFESGETADVRLR